MPSILLPVRLLDGDGSVVVVNTDHISYVSRLDDGATDPHYLITFGSGAPPLAVSEKGSKPLMQWITAHQQHDDMS